MGGLSLYGRHVAAGLGLVVLVAVVYGGSLGHTFVFDDWQLVVNNAVVTWPLSEALDLIEHRSGGVSYRPVRMLSYMVDHAVAGGIDASVFHASNLIYHALATLVLYALALRTIGSYGPALFAAALFAVHPLGSEAVVYVSGRRDLLSGLFALVGLLSWWAFCDATAWARRGVALFVTLLAAVLALGAKENAAVFPALALLLFVVHVRREPGAHRGSPAVWAGLLVGVVALWVVVDQLYLERVYEAVERLRGDPLAAQPALTLGVLGQYGWRSIWPVQLYADYRPPGWALPTTALDAPSVVSAISFAAVIALGMWLVWRGRVAGAGLLWFPLALLPVAQIVPYREIVAEHNAYLPLAGLALAVGDGARALSGRWPRVVAVVGVLVVALLGARAHARTADWVDDETLWSVTLEQLPDSVRARHNLATAYARRGRLERARGLLQEANAQAPEEVEVLESLATVEGRLGNDPAALTLAQRAVEIEPTAARYTFLGWVQLGAGAEASAGQSFRRALRQDWDYEDARRGLEQVRQSDRQRRYLRQGRTR